MVQIRADSPSVSESSYVHPVVATDHPSGRPASTLGVLAVLFGWLVYFLYVRVAFYWIGFLANWRVARSVDSGPVLPMAWALAINVLLVLAFVLPHSLLARAGGKAWLARWVAPALERSVYVLVASVFLALLIWLWRALPATVWEVHGLWPRRLWWTGNATGWILSVAASKSLGHARLFGLEAAWRWARGHPPRPAELRTTGLYGRLRHPMYLGFALGIWVTPRMSVGHLFLAVSMTVYLFVGAWFEERDLERRFGAEYREYRRRVPALGLTCR